MTALKNECEIFFRGAAVPSKEKDNKVLIKNTFIETHFTVLNIKKLRKLSINRKVF